VSEPQATLRQLFGALPIDPLPRIVGTAISGRRVTIHDSNANAIAFNVVELNFVPASSRSAQRMERQLDRAFQTAEASLLNPLQAMRHGVRFMAGAVEETIGAVQDAPFDPATQTLDLVDDVTLTLDSVAAPALTLDTLDATVELLRAEATGPGTSIRLLATGITFEVFLASEEVVDLLQERLPSGYSARVDVDGELLIDWSAARGRVSAICEIGVVDGAITVAVERAVVLGRTWVLPRRYRRTETLALDSVVPTLSVTALTLRDGGFSIAGLIRRWERELTREDIRSITSQLTSAST